MQITAKDVDVDAILGSAQLGDAPDVGDWDKMVMKCGAMPQAELSKLCEHAGLNSNGSKGELVDHLSQHAYLQQ